MFFILSQGHILLTDGGGYLSFGEWGKRVGPILSKSQRNINPTSTLSHTDEEGVSHCKELWAPGIGSTVLWEGGVHSAALVSCTSQDECPVTGSSLISAGALPESGDGRGKERAERWFPSSCLDIWVSFGYTSATGDLSSLELGMSMTEAAHSPAGQGRAAVFGQRGSLHSTSSASKPCPLRSLRSWGQRHRVLWPRLPKNL